MATFRQLHIKIWSSPDFQALSPHGKLVFIYLFGNDHRNEACLYRITPRTIANETALSVDEVEMAIAETVNQGIVKFDPENNIVWVVNAIHYQTLSPNEVKAIRKDIERLGKHPFARELTEYYQEVFSRYEGTPKDLPRPSEGAGDKGKGKGKGKGNKKTLVPPCNETMPSKPKPKFNDQHMALAVLLRDRILQNKPDRKLPTSLNSWADTIRLMTDIDKRDPERIRAVIDFSQSDYFWWKNILSADKLREKFDRLETDMQGERPKVGQYTEGRIAPGGTTGTFADSQSQRNSQKPKKYAGTAIESGGQ